MTLDTEKLSTYTSLMSKAAAARRATATNKPMTAANKARVMDMILDLAELGSVSVRLNDGGDCIVITVRDANADFVGDAMAFIRGPYADNCAVFSASEGVRKVVAKRYPRHLERYETASQRVMVVIPVPEPQGSSEDVGQ